MAAETKRFTITIPLYFYKMAEQIAKEKHVTTNDILRKAIMNYLSAYETVKRQNGNNV